MADGALQAQKIGGKRQRFTLARLSPDRRKLALISAKGYLYIVELKDKEFDLGSRLLTNKGPLVDLAWRADSSRVAVASKRGGVYLYDVGSSPDKAAQVQADRETAAVRLQLRRDRVLAALSDGSIRYFSLLKGEDAITRGTPTSPTRHWALAGDLAIGSDAAGRVIIRDLKPGSKPRITLFTHGMTWLAWTEDGSHAGSDTGIELLRVLYAEGTERRAIPATILKELRTRPLGL